MPERRRSTARAGRRARSVTRAGRARATPQAVRVLAVDVGNSETTVGLFRGAAVEGFWRLTSRPHTADELTLIAEGLLRGAGAPALDGTVLCSVVPALSAPWGGALARLAEAAPVEVGAATARRQLRIRYVDPSAIGADRIANAIGVRARYGTPAIVVDLGTATTFDCISRRGEYLGGVIAPGVSTSAEELFRRAARLSRVELSRPPRAVGRTTEEALQAGVLWGHAGQVDALVRRVAREMGGRPHVVATGGWARVIAPECETVQHVDETLTLEGMRLLWERAR